MQADKEYTCAYKYCLHHGQKVKSSESVVISKKHYHWDCALKRQEIKDCVDLYMSYREDQSQYPMATRIINTIIYKSNVPVDFVMRQIESGKKYYVDRPPQALYGIRKIFWEREFKV